MPTGYTACISDGADFKNFAMGCARAFGACVSLRDSDDPIPDTIEPSSYHKDAGHRAREELVALLAMTHVDRETAAAKAHADESERRRKSGERVRAQHVAYHAMLAWVYAWTPPTPEHANLRSFMIDQINMSIDFDCPPGLMHPNEPAHITGDEWFDERHRGLHRDIAYHDREYAAEVERCAKRTAWLQALRGSL